jgi:hypothetical protein
MVFYTMLKMVAGKCYHQKKCLQKKNNHSNN